MLPDVKGKKGSVLGICENAARVRGVHDLQVAIPIHKPRPSAAKVNNGVLLKLDKTSQQAKLFGEEGKNQQ